MSGQADDLPAPPQVRPRLDVEALYVALDRKRRQLRISGAEVLRQSGIGIRSRSVWTRLAHGDGPSADNLVRFLVWLGETDVKPFVHQEPITEEGTHAS
jgi:transcriptional regulator with XRE-family HTH domain